MGIAAGTQGVDVCSSHTLRVGSDFALPAALPPGVLGSTKGRATRSRTFLDPPHLTSQGGSSGTDALSPLAKTRVPTDNLLGCSRSN